jgi:antibiotic biosynthesis monooxygenase (ABM) superfamily enzyme
MTENPQKPKKWKMLLVSWLFIYPLINVMFAVVFPLVKEQHQLVKTLVFTLILVPIMGIFLPMIHKRFWNCICK